MNNEALVFECDGNALLGIVHGIDATARRGAVIVVGGPQYRVGSHRQFVHLARALAAGGLPCLRFDYRGMGDSDGDHVGFEDVDADIRGAIDALFARCDNLEEIVLLGLCDAASAALMYAPTDQRVRHVVAMNPWVRSEESLARATVKHYYLQRLLAPQMWAKVLRGQFDWRGSLASLRTTLGSLRGKSETTSEPTRGPFQQRMLQGAQAFDGNVLLVISGDDMTAAEFMDLVATQSAWQAVLEDAKTTVHRMATANHTFACTAWRDEVGAKTMDWLSAFPESSSRD